MSLTDFIRESNRIEGIVREPLLVEIGAHEEFLALDTIIVENVEMLVARIAAAPLRALDGMNVRVGSHIAPSGGPEIVWRLETILKAGETAGAYKTHLAYEALHPFMDGNGRSGRALWLWMMGGEAPLGFLHQFYYQTLDATNA